MFTRKHRIGRHLYTEALESYRDPDTGRLRHQCLVRWRAERSFAEELEWTQFSIEHATRNLAFWRERGTKASRAPGTLPLLWGGLSMSRTAMLWRRRLDRLTVHFAALTAARDAGLSADDVQIEQACGPRRRVGHPSEHRSE